MNGSTSDSTQHQGRRRVTPVGQTLSLFDGLSVSSVPTNLPDREPTASVRSDDPHMKVAWRLSRALKGRGRAARTVKALNAQQRHQLGGVICDHLLASLRQQVAIEQAQRRH